MMSAASTVRQVAADPVEYWALIVCGEYEPTWQWFAADSAFMYHTLRYHFSFNGIYYLHPDPSIAPEANGTATKENMRWAITNWLNQSSDSNDIVFIYFTDHGAGFNSHTNETEGLDEPEHAIDGSRGDPVDEGNEFWNATMGRWMGFDETIMLQLGNDRTYWDDEVKSDLDYLASRGKYGKLIFVSFACYSGGLVDDLSAPNRLIITSANETYTSQTQVPGDFFNAWSECFIEALHRQKVNWNPYSHSIVHTGIPVNADWSNDRNVSMWEAWDYAWKNDYYRQQGNETPWLDDNGNHQPNYIQGSETLDSYDGLLSMETYFGSANLRTADVNNDAIVDIVDVSIVAVAFGSRPGDPKWNPLADLNNDRVIDIIDITHVAIHLGKWYPTGSGSRGTQTSSALMEGNISLSVRPSKDHVFSVDVNVAGAANLYSYEFKVYYDKVALNCVGVDLSKGHFLEPINNPNKIFTAKMEFDNTYNATHGRIWVAVTLLGDEPSKIGDGTLVTITFTDKAKVSPTFSLQDTILVKAEPPSAGT